MRSACPAPPRHCIRPDADYITPAASRRWFGTLCRAAVREGGGKVTVDSLGWERSEGRGREGLARPCGEAVDPTHANPLRPIPPHARRLAHCSARAQPSSLLRAASPFDCNPTSTPPHHPMAAAPPRTSQYVRNQLCRVEAMASADVPSTVLAQRLADKRTMEEAVDEAVRAVAGGLVRNLTAAARAISS